VAVAALLLWLCTAAVGSYLLLTGIRSPIAEPPPADPASVPSGQPAAVAAESPAVAVAQGPPRPVRDKDRFDPPSLQRAKSEPMPGLHDLAEFTHPALAMIGVGFWVGFVVSRDRLFAVIGLGILLGAICAGISWFIINTRAARRAAAASADDAGSVAEDSGHPALSFSPRLIALHAAGAVLTVLFAALIAARV